MKEFVETHVEASESNPFPGLRPFTIDESHLFFGREGQSDEVLVKLSKNRFVAVIGPSGSGKSSFIYCGVLPILYGGFLTETGPNWDVVVTRPGVGPIENLAESLLQTDPSYVVADAEEQKIKRTIITTLLKSSSLGLVEAIQQTARTEDKNYLILVDQFEELFRFKDSKDRQSVNETLAFVNLLNEASNYPDASIYVAITMRSDFIGDCAQFPELTKKINDSHYLIPQLTREQKRRAITGPVAVGGAHITQPLIQQLLNDLGDNPDQLPILQHSLMRTWSYWARHQEYEDEPLDLKHYDAIGTMTEALSLHANEAYDELNEDQKRICEVLFRAITEKRGENFGIRRPTTLGDIAAIAGVAEEDLISVIDKFREEGRSLVTPNALIPLSSNSMIDISHESLMRIWVRLKTWVDEEADAVQMYLRLSEAAAMYQVGKAGLWRPPDLQLALNWQVKHNPTLVWGQRYHPAFERTIEFLEYSKKEFETEQQIKELQQKRALKRARVTALILGAATVISIAFLLYAFVERANANRERDNAIVQQTRADSLKLVAFDQRELAVVRQKEAEEARDQADSAKNEAVRALTLAEERRIQAEQAESRAKAGEAAANFQKLVADTAKLKAQENERLAKQQTQIAQEQKELADRLRYLAISKAMAIKSTQIEEGNLKGLLAQQAYVFNKEYDGYSYDNDVYDGLYYAIKTLGDPLVNNLDGHPKSVRSLVANPNGNYLYSAGSEGKILRWKVEGAQRVADTIAMVRDNHVLRALAIDENNKWLAAGGEIAIKGSDASIVEVYDLSSPGSKPTILRGYNREVWNLIFTKNNDKDALISLDNLGKSIKMSDLTTVTEVAVPSVRLNEIALSYDGKWLIGAGSDGKIYMYDVANGFEESEIFDNGENILAIAFSNKSYRFAIGDQRGGVKVLELSNQQPLSFIGHKSQIDDIKFSNDDQFLATASKDKSVRLWNLDKPNEQPITLRDHPDWVWTIAFSPDNQQILAGTQERIIRAWPTQIETMSDKICGKISENFSQDQWDVYVAEDLDYQVTCENLPANNK
ncbi:MAG: High-affnity carbon uptake protein Hat/HatR [Bacteroidota bacterium]